MNLRFRPVSSLLAVSLTVTSTLARVEPVGVVTQARNASLSHGALSAGASVYDGDTLATDADGALTLRASSSMIHLGRQTRVTLRSASGRDHCSRFDLTSGTVTFSTPQAAMEIHADQADIHAATEALTIGQITILTPNSFEIYARRGALKIQYREETQAIAEGTSYRVVLDAASPDDNASAKTAPIDKPKPIKVPSHKRKRIALFAIGSTGAASALAIPWAMSNDYESPDHP